MKRRDFLKSVSGIAVGAAVQAPAIWSPAKADARSETLLVVTEGGPNNLDIHGVGTNRPGYETSWNCYDRLISHETKTLPDGSQSYDRDKFKLELAEDMNVGDMSVTFKLKKNAKFHDGTSVTAKDGCRQATTPDSASRLVSSADCTLACSIRGAAAAMAAASPPQASW